MRDPGRPRPRARRSGRRGAPRGRGRPPGGAGALPWRSRSAPSRARRSRRRSGSLGQGRSSSRTCSCPARTRARLHKSWPAAARGTARCRTRRAARAAPPGRPPPAAIVAAAPSIVLRCCPEPVACPLFQLELRLRLPRSRGGAERRWQAGGNALGTHPDCSACSACSEPSQRRRA